MVPLKRPLIAVTLVLLVVCGGRAGYVVWRLHSTWTHGKQLYESGDYSGAAIAFREYSSLTSEDAEGHYWLGNALGFSNRLPEAVTELRRAAELDPKNAEYHIVHGNALRMLNRHGEALEAFQKAVALTPRDADLRVSVGSTLSVLGRRREAAQEFQQALQIQPGHRRAAEGLRRLRQ